MNYPAYSKYKASGIEWLGDVPGKWKVKPLKCLTSFINGAAFKPENWSDEGIPIIRIVNLNGGEDFNCYEGSINKRYHIQNRDLLFGWSGNRGTSFGPFIWWREGLHYLNQHIFKLEDYSCTKKWFYWTLKAVTGYIEEEAHGIIGMVHVTKAKLGAVKVPLPEILEQQAIADYLDHETSRIDELIEKKREFINKLKEKRTALISHAVTKGLDPDVKLKPSGIKWLDEIPEHWEEVVPLRRKCRKITDGAHISPDTSSEDFPFVSTVDIKNGKIDFESCLKTSIENYEYLVHTGCKPQKGDVLFSKDGTVGRTAVVDFICDFVVASSLVIITPNSNHLDFHYLEYWLNNSLLKQEVELLLSGAALKRISIVKVSNLPVVTPPLDEQCRIVSYLNNETSKIDSLIDKVEKAIEKLQEYRSSIISAAVTGKIDVRETV